MATAKPDLLWNFAFWRRRGARELSGSKPCGWRHLDGRTESEKQECSLSCLSGRLMWEMDAGHSEWNQVDFSTASAITLLHSWHREASSSPASRRVLASLLSSCSYLHPLFPSLPLDKKQGISSSSTSQHFRANMSSSIKVPWTNN